MYVIVCRVVRVVPCRTFGVCRGVSTTENWAICRSGRLQGMYDISVCVCRYMCVYVRVMNCAKLTPSLPPPPLSLSLSLSLSP